MNRYSKFSLLAAAIATAGTVAYASQGGIENDAMAITKAKITLAQAVITEQQHANGKAARAEYENSKWLGLRRGSRQRGQGLRCQGRCQQGHGHFGS